MTMKIKTVCVAANAIHSCLQNPAAPLGEHGDIRTVEITDIPKGTPAAVVVRLWDQTCDLSYLGSEDCRYPRHTYRFEELGEGRIIRG